jgi:hypothetical protein
MMSKYKKRPVIVDAVMWDGDEDKMEAFITIDWGIANDENDLVIFVEMERRLARLGDYVIKNTDGRFRTCSAGLFALYYEEVKDEPSI